MSLLVLVVDDDREIRHMLAMLLRLSGFETDEAVDGLDALGKIKQRRPDVIILDIMMPNMDGVTLCKLLRREPQTAHMPIIILSGKTLQKDVEEGLNAGADRYLVKPMGLDRLTQTIDELLQDTLAQQGSRQLYG